MECDFVFQREDPQFKNISSIMPGRWLSGLEYPTYLSHACDYCVHHREIAGYDKEREREREREREIERERQKTAEREKHKEREIYLKNNSD